MRLVKLAAVVVMCSTVAAASVYAQAHPDSPAATLKQDMRKLWTDHVVWTRNYIIAATSDQPDAQAAVNRLMKNQEDIGKAIEKFYGANVGQNNNACYRSPEFDRRYEQSRMLPDGPERDTLYREMTRLMEVHTAWILGDSRYRNVLLQPHVVGYRKHPVLHAESLYIDLDTKGAR